MQKKLSVNLDHIATLRQLRNTPYPLLTTAVGICELAGADGITLHLREDRRHIQDRDVELVTELSFLPLTLEMGATEEMVGIAGGLRPQLVTLVPEKREELTTEGGLNAVGLKNELTGPIQKLQSGGINVCLFLEPDPDQIRAAADLGCAAVEIHTGNYALYLERNQQSEYRAEWRRICETAQLGVSLGLKMNVGHGLQYQNVEPLAALETISEFSIGHAIVCRAVFTGLEQAVREMSRKIKN